MRNLRSKSLGGSIVLAGFTLLSLYFILAAVQGKYGVMSQIGISAEVRMKKSERDHLAADLASIKNLTRRMSDDFLDADLLDQQARDVLGYVRATEIVIR